MPPTLNSTLPTKLGSPLLSTILKSDLAKSGLFILIVWNDQVDPFPALAAIPFTFLYWLKSSYPAVLTIPNSPPDLGIDPSIIPAGQTALFGEYIDLPTVEAFLWQLGGQITN